MNFSGFNNYEDLMRFCGFSTDGNENSQGCSDIPGGFQDLDPQLFSIIGQVVGLAISGSLPVNVQNAIGNWLQLVGQVIETCSAQQQYFQNGPGKYYDIRNKNIYNPSCDTKGSQQSSGEVEDLKKEINKLIKEVKRLNEEVEDLKKK